ncbi:uncharacterized protein LOC134223798 isoform X2 [Armigeres subalbatus]|uniref:uncharacterized protein LOC134223798 isoform X2 n=1 Tax=Armigeres subalbatus TaxID=124917 RepID=UPI002ECFDB5E
MRCMKSRSMTTLLQHCNMKCIVPSCRNEEGLSCTRFFAVPPTNNKSFKNWTKRMHLSGQRKEKNCADHFSSSDFITYSRKHLKNKAVPSFRLPKNGLKVDPRGACCIRGCSTKMRKLLFKFPIQPRIREVWMKILAIENTSNLKVCHRHFTLKDFRTVNSVYLKPGAVPTKKVPKLVKRVKRSLGTRSSFSHLWDHNYCARQSVRPKSNRICYVTGCYSRASQEISLHKFPANTDQRFHSWLKELRCSRMPTKNSTVCSRHFVEADYLPGGRRLKKIYSYTIEVSSWTRIRLYEQLIAHISRCYKK